MKKSKVFVLFLVTLISSCDLNRDYIAYSANSSMPIESSTTSDSFLQESSDFDSLSESDLEDESTIDQGDTTEGQESNSTTEDTTIDKDYLTIMSYNVGSWYNGRSDLGIPPDLQDFYYELQNDSINMYSPDLLFLQEYSPVIGDHYVPDTVLKDFFNYSFSENATYQGKCISSKGKLSSSELLSFQQSDEVPRNYEKAYLDIGSKHICLISLHLSVNLLCAKSEVDEIIGEIDNEEYFIVCGDFNTNCRSTNGHLFSTIYNPFLKLGCNMSNCSQFGFLDTYFDKDGGQALDNIITSNNISVLSVDTCKLKRQRGVSIDEIDHIPLIAYLKLL